MVVTIAHRASVGQRRYGCLRLAHEMMLTTSTTTTARRT
jgi:hypothetical protein